VHVAVEVQEPVDAVPAVVVGLGTPHRKRAPWQWWSDQLFEGFDLR
jgi:hypothetical protein